MTVLTLGDKGPLVKKLQEDLIKLGYSVGDNGPDGDYGHDTRAAVYALQLDYIDVDDDGAAGEQTLGKIRELLAVMDVPHDIVRCDDNTWSHFEKLADLIMKTPVRYGPGRGLWNNGRFIITHGPGALNSNNWKNFLGRPYPSFHCSSWSNFFTSWLLRYNEIFTHAGNIPDLSNLVKQDTSPHQNPGAGPYRGFGPFCSVVTPDGSAVKRHGMASIIDARELLSRCESLPSFMVFSQSSLVHGNWKYWHHTGVYATRGNRLLRIAADGYRDAVRGYSANPMYLTEITDKNVGNLDGAVYRVWAINPHDDGTYGITNPIASVEIEA